MSKLQTLIPTAVSLVTLYWIIRDRTERITAEEQKIELFKSKHAEEQAMQCMSLADYMANRSVIQNL